MFEILLDESVNVFNNKKVLFGIYTTQKGLRSTIVRFGKTKSYKRDRIISTTKEYIFLTKVALSSISEFFLPDSFNTNGIIDKFNLHRIQRF